MFKKMIFFIPFSLPFFAAILASILELLGYQKSSLVAIFRSQDHGSEIRPPPFISYILLSAHRNPKMCQNGPLNMPKCPQNVPQRPPKA